MIKYQIVLVPFPFDDFSGTKVRPAICLTNEIGFYRHVVIAFISSQVPPLLEPTELLLEKKESDFRTTGLLVDSVIKLHRMVTIPRGLI
jgi:mRNA interferase MazF